MIYLAGCAIAKLATPEVESAALDAWLAARPAEGLFTSKLSEVEVPRALRRGAPGALDGAASVLARIYRVDLCEQVRATAAAYPDPNLRSLDALHLATADAVAETDLTVTAFVAYDKRLAAAAAEAGHNVVSPGA